MSLVVYTISRHVLKLTVTCPLASHLQIMSDTNDFILGDEDLLIGKVVSVPVRSIGRSHVRITLRLSFVRSRRTPNSRHAPKNCFTISTIPYKHFINSIKTKANSTTVFDSIVIKRRHRQISPFNLVGKRSMTPSTRQYAPSFKRLQRA
jgi:hypothetical protein